MRTLGTAGAPSGAYDGPAVVERSTKGELVLAFGASVDDAGGEAGAGSATGGLYHATLSGLTPMPLLPPGARVWLSKSPLVDPSFSFYSRPRWSLSVRDREDGTLLFGAGLDDFASAASPVRIGEVEPVCVATNVNLPCSPGGNMTYSSVEVLGDAPVVIEDSASAPVTLGGEEYDVWVTAQAENGGSGMTCLDYVPPSGVGIYVQASRLDELVGALDVGPVPECSPGNDPDVSVYFALYGVSASTAHEGVVTYIGRDPAAEDAYAFDVPGLTSVTDTPPTLSIVRGARLLPEPEVGQEFWLSFRSVRAQALREAQGGPVILAHGSGTPNDDAAAELGELLGVTVSVEVACDYTSTITLKDTVFGTDPEVRVASGTTGTLVLDGRTYRVWAWGQDGNSATVYPAN